MMNPLAVMRPNITNVASKNGASRYMPEAQMKMIKRANDHKREMMLTCLKYCCSDDNGARQVQAAKNFLRVQDLPANFEENEKGRLAIG
jgi:hypothetical protein